MFSEVGVEGIEQLQIGGLDFRYRVGIHAQLGQVSIHPRHDLVGHGLTGASGELVMQKAFLGVTVAPAVVHGVGQHGLGAVVGDDYSEHPLQQPIRVGGIAHALLLKVVDDIQAVLNDVTLRRFQHRDNAALDNRQNAGVEIRIGGGDFGVGNALGSQVAAGDTGVQRMGNPVEPVRVVLAGHDAS